MINLLSIIPNTEDATSFYRACGPLAGVRKDEEIHLVFANKITWATVTMQDAVFIQRPFLGEHLAAAQMANRCKRPLWIDFDDYLFGVPRDNPCYKAYMTPEAHEHIAKIMGMADAITFSTPRLKELMHTIYDTIRKHKPKYKLPVMNAKSFVVPNAFNDLMFPFEPATKNHKMIMWRGSNTHQHDLLTYGGEMLELAQEHPDWTWSFLGYDPFFITQAMPKKSAVIIDPLEIGEYFEFIKVVQPAIQVVPLSRHDFNECKSNIAWIEATYAGAVTVAPDWPEWRRPGVVTYSNPHEFKACLKFLMENPGNLAKMHEMSVEFISKHLLLSDVNVQRRLIIRGMLDDVSWPDGGEVPNTEGVRVSEERQ